MKKILALLMCMVISVGLVTGCGKDDEVVSTSSSSQKDSDGDVKSTNANFEEQVIVDKDDIKITAKGLVYNKSDIEIRLLIENNSDNDLDIAAANFSINDLVLNPSFYGEVAAGKSLNDSIKIYKEDLDKANIKAIKDIVFDIDISDAHTWNRIFKETDIEITTDLEDYEQEYNEDGEIIFDDKDIKIYVLGLDEEDPTWGTEVNLYIENNSDKNTAISINEVSVNGFMVDTYFSADLEANKKTYKDIVLYKDSLDENEIKTVENIEFKIRIKDTDNWDTIILTDPIKVEF